VGFEEGGEDKGGASTEEKKMASERKERLQRYEEEAYATIAQAHLDAVLSVIDWTAFHSRLLECLREGSRSSGLPPVGELSRVGSRRKGRLRRELSTTAVRLLREQEAAKKKETRRLKAALERVMAGATEMWTSILFFLPERLVPQLFTAILSDPSATFFSVLCGPSEYVRKSFSKGIFDLCLATKRQTFAYSVPPPADSPALSLPEHKRAASPSTPSKKKKRRKKSPKKKSPAKKKKSGKSKKQKTSSSSSPSSGSTSIPCIMFSIVGIFFLRSRLNFLINFSNASLQAFGAPQL